MTFFIVINLSINTDPLADAEYSQTEGQGTFPSKPELGFEHRTVEVVVNTLTIGPQQQCATINSTHRLN